MTVTIINADVMEGLSKLADESVHCVVTSPPYWGLRDYGTARWEGGVADCDHLAPAAHGYRPHETSTLGPKRDGMSAANSAHSDAVKRQQFRRVCGKCGAVRVDNQIGLEPTLGEHIDRLVEVFREVRRVLRYDGTLWINYGDCYATAPNGRSAADTKAIGTDDRTFRDKPFSTIGPIYDPEGGAKGGGYRGANKSNGAPDATPLGRVVAGGTLKAKDLCMIPHRLAIALQDDGWWVRSDIVWSKPNPMPESIKDRPTKSHEYVFLLTKSERYWYDADAIREKAEYVGPNSPASQASPYGQGFTRRAEELKRIGVKGNAKTFRGGGNYTQGQSRDNDASTQRDSHGNKPNDSLSRNKRSVWSIATAPFPDAHFATFPPELPETCIKAGCPEGGTVLDPFGGAGTTGLVADRLQRNAVLIELNPEYAAMAERRVNADRGALLDLMEPSEPPLFSEAAQ